MLVLVLERGEAGTVVFQFLHLQCGEWGVHSVQSVSPGENYREVPEPGGSVSPPPLSQRYNSLVRTTTFTTTTITITTTFTIRMPPLRHNKLLTPLTDQELDSVTIVFHQYETGLREGTIYTKVSRRSRGDPETFRPIYLNFLYYELW